MIDYQIAYHRTLELLEEAAHLFDLSQKGLIAKDEYFIRVDKFKNSVDDEFRKIMQQNGGNL